MKIKNQFCLFVFVLFVFHSSFVFASLPQDAVSSHYNDGDFKIFHKGRVASIYVDTTAPVVCHIAAENLSDDIERICGTKAPIFHSIDDLKGHVIFIGITGGNSVIDTLVSRDKLNVSDIVGLWESTVITVVDKPISKVEKGLVIAGSDRRGAAFGVFDLSEKMGVSPWYWWADVAVERRDSIVVRNGRYKCGPPSVKYRGIFINDEDWGLHTWAKNTYAPEDDGIGPKTYKIVFELLLRLKANHIWPAMHPCTKAFNAYKENKKIADDYAIVMGSSHCEQMLRNNVYEWKKWNPPDGSAHGEWDWCTNSEQILEYWRERIKENAPYENIYTMGMRGIHDGSMPCARISKREKVAKMQDELFPLQRQILSEWVNSDLSEVPQIFCPYKEVLELYNMNMQLPDDITLVWPDDNHGYIRRLSNSAERMRSGEAGVYYHISYWGSPHDYLWLCSTPPALIWEEMKKAYDYGADRVWILNVGDIKPAEIGIEFFMQMAWDIDRWDETNLDQFLIDWAARKFGPEYKNEIADIMYEYYRLGQARKPEHMGWSTIYPTTPTKEPEFSPIYYNDETQKRIDQYKKIEDQTRKIYNQLPNVYRDSFYQLVYYPVYGASLMNQKYLYAQKSRLYAKQGRVSANQYAEMAQTAHDKIIEETQVYNNEIADGKWKDIISWNPRGLPVYKAPKVATVEPVSGKCMGVVIEGQSQEVSDVKTEDISFYDDFRNESESLRTWRPLHKNQWDIRSFEFRKEYAIKSTDHENLSGDRLGELSIIDDQNYDNFHFSCLARSCDDLRSNTAADFAIVFGYVDENNYNYMIFNRTDSNTGLYRIVNGVRIEVKKSAVIIPDNEFHPVEIKKTNKDISIYYRQKNILNVSENFSSGRIGVGSFNDAGAFTDITIKSMEPSVYNELPVFDVFTRQRRFIDIFNKGDTAFKWEAVASKQWIHLSENKGTIKDQQRIWVDINWNSVPAGNHEETIKISGADEAVNIKVRVSNLSTDIKNFDGFVQTNGYVSIEAEHFTNKSARNRAGWEVIPTLGRCGDSIMILPTTTQSITQVSGIIKNSPMLEYQVYFSEAGEQKVTIYCLPTHAITSEHGLRYAIAFDEQSPEIVEYDTAEWSAGWKVNVLRGIAVSKSKHILSKPGKHTLKIWMVDPGVVIDKIVIGETRPSYLGPPETKNKAE